jgi:hypothetical protein
VVDYGPVTENVVKKPATESGRAKMAGALAPFVCGGGYIDLDPRATRRYHVFWPPLTAGWLALAGCMAYGDRLLDEVLLGGCPLSLVLVTTGGIGILAIRRRAPKPVRRGGPGSLY